MSKRDKKLYIQIVWDLTTQELDELVNNIKKLMI